MINDIKPSAEDFQETIPAEEEDGEPTKNELTYVHGRIFLDNGKWIFESFKHVFEKKDYADVVQSLADLYAKTNVEYSE